MSDWHKIGTTGIGGMGDVYVAPVGTPPRLPTVRREYVSYLASYDQVERVACDMASNVLANVLSGGTSIYAGNISIRLDHGETSDALSVTVKWIPDE